MKKVKVIPSMPGKAIRNQMQALEKWKSQARCVGSAKPDV